MPIYNTIKPKASVAAEPIMATRTWAQTPLANLPLEAHHQTTLGAAGCSFSKDEVGAIKVHPHAWLDPIEVIKFFDDTTAGELQDAAGEWLLTYKERGKKVHYAQKSFLMVYSWDILKANELIFTFGPAQSKKLKLLVRIYNTLCLFVFTTAKSIINTFTNCGAGTRIR